MTRQRNIQTVLVANRGEIARRVFRACRELGVRSVAAYSDVDAGSVWSRQADLSVRLPGHSAAETYLNIEALLAAAREVGADAVHPGYGFLSESPDFATACESAGLTFIGPTPEAMRALSSKAKARGVAAAAGVPVVPGVDGWGRSDEELAASAARIGYPVLIKASDGGGGRGVRLVTDPSGFSDALRAAKLEAAATFGSDHVLIEKHLPSVRHVEVQLLGDGHGNVIHLFERECSIQRRHQKLIEESPAPGIDAELRRVITGAAVALARAVDYTSAGTAEFLLAPDGQFYFLEMNTRMQVEHPVTEMVTGVDLVSWQIRVAAGAALGFGQEAVVQHGHALECRIYAEDPARGFLPSTGKIALFRPPGGPGVRCDDGIASGAVITSHYDALLAKVITTGWDRPDALRRMRQALAETVILGVTTNVDYLQDVVDHPLFRSGQTTTGFLEEQMAGWQPPVAPTDEAWLAMAAFESLSPAASTREEPWRSDGLFADPWSEAAGWRNVP